MSTSVLILFFDLKQAILHKTNNTIEKEASFTILIDKVEKILYHIRVSTLKRKDKTMKKILSFILLSVMILSTLSCTVSTEKIISNGDVKQLAAQDTYNSTNTVYATEGTYVRGGTYKDTIPSELPQQDYYFIKYDVVENTFRTPILKFDISDFVLPENTQSISLVVDFATFSQLHKDNADEELKINVYTTTDNWDSKTVTYASLPALSNDNVIGSEYIIKGEVYIDISDFIRECKANGVNTFSLRLAATARSQAEMRINMLGSPNGPRIVAKETSARTFYQSKILADEKANQELWDYAKAIYDAWEIRYNEIISKGDYNSATITSNPEDYKLKTEAIMQDQGNKGGTFDTRLVTTLNGFTEKGLKLDIYGGVISETRYESTGFFYTKKIGDRWWVIDPLGYPCYITGINHTVYAYSASEYQTRAMIRNFGGASKWAISTTRWLQNDLGFNIALASGNTQTDLILDVQNGLSTTISTGGVGSYASQIGLNSSDGGQTNFLYNDAMPVFDPAFDEYIKTKIPSSISKYSDNPRILGFVSDNELPVSNDMLVNYLSLDPTIKENIYSYVCAWTWLTETTKKKGEDIDIYHLEKLSDETGFDLANLFKGFVYDRYFSVIQPVVKSVCPNHMYLGVRMLIGGDWEWMARVNGYWCDVMCINYYRVWEIPTEQLELLQKWTGKPIMITEFYAKGADAIGSDGKLFLNTYGAGWTCKTQTERGYFYQNFTLRLLEAKNCIGWLYFQYIDNDPLDETVEEGQKHSNKGIVNSDLDREVYKDYHSQIGLINRNKYALVEHFDGIEYFK